MLRGMVSGGMLGALVAFVGLALASLAAPPPGSGEPPQAPIATTPEVADIPDAPAEPGEAPVQPATPQIGAPATAPSQVVPDAEVAAVPAADTAPGIVPRTEAVTDRPGLPEPSATPVLPAAAEAPVLPNPQAVAPSQPAGEAEVIVSTDPSAPAETAGQVDGDALPEVADAEPEIGDDAPAPASAPEDRVAPATETAQVAPEPAAEDAADPEEAARVVVRGEAAGLPGGGEDVVVNRSVPEPQAEASADLPEEAVAEAAAPEAPPLERFGADFENPEGLPLLSIVLIDDGSLEDAPTAVASIGIPLTVAIDPSRPDAGEAMAAYRARGIEVAVLPRLPEGAEATDVEVTLEAALTEVPQAVALVDATGAWQSGGGVAEQALARLGAEGRGFVTISSGLNAGLRAAAAEDVPAVIVYRDLDAEGQDARVIRRFVDQAAFRARQSSGVVLLGRVRADTISALTLWSTANRAAQVALAPLSAVLRAEGA